MTPSWITDKIKDFSNNDPDWVIFVQDHLPMIKQHSKKINVSDFDAILYRHNITLFLIHLKYDPTLTWIIKMLNKIEDKKFNKPMVLYVPEYNYIAELFSIYRDTRSL